MGLLTGKFSAGATLPIDDVRGRHSPEWMRYFTNGQPNPVWLKKLEGRARYPLERRSHASPGSVGLALGTKQADAKPIPGFRTIAQVEENCAGHAPWASDRRTDALGLTGIALVLTLQQAIDLTHLFGGQRPMAHGSTVFFDLRDGSETWNR